MYVCNSTSLFARNLKCILKYLHSCVQLTSNPYIQYYASANIFGQRSMLNMMRYAVRVDNEDSNIMKFMAVIVKMSFSNQNLIGFLFLTKLSLCIVRALLRKFNIFMCFSNMKKEECFQECFRAKKSLTLFFLYAFVWHLFC